MSGKLSIQEIITVAQTADLVMCRGKRVVSKAIMRATKSNWSHAAIFIKLEGRLFVIDAQRDGVNLRPFEAWHLKYNYEFEVFRSYSSNYQHAPNYVKSRAFQKIGVTGYDFESLIIRQPIKLITGEWRVRVAKEGDRMVCTEFTAWSYSIPEWFKMDPDGMYNWIQENGLVQIAKNY